MKQEQTGGDDRQRCRIAPRVLLAGVSVVEHVFVSEGEECARVCALTLRASFVSILVLKAC